jgi:hypothetical protein
MRRLETHQSDGPIGFPLQQTVGGAMNLLCNLNDDKVACRGRTDVSALLPTKTTYNERLPFLHSICL